MRTVIINVFIILNKLQSLSVNEPNLKFISLSVILHTVYKYVLTPGC